MDELTSSLTFAECNRSALVSGVDVKKLERSFEKIDTLSSSQEYIPNITSKNSPDTKNKKEFMQKDSGSNRETNDVRDETYMEKLKNIGTNLKYNLGILGQTLIWRSEPSHQAYIFGREISENLDNDIPMKTLCINQISNIIWFSYRKNFPPLIKKKIEPQKESYINDTGWGCMIRACQMAFAQCLNESTFQGNIANKDRNKLRDLNLIAKFLDSNTNPEEAPYSIQNISSILFDRFKLKPGIWFKPSSVLLALQDIHVMYKPQNEDEKTNLEMEIFLEGTIYLKPILTKMVAKLPEIVDNRKYEEGFEVIEDDEDEESSDCENKSETKSEELKPRNYIEEMKLGDFFDQNDYSSKEEINRLMAGTWQNYLMITVLAKIGLDKPNPEYLSCVKKLLRLPQSRGMIGGKPGLAYYIVGYWDDKLIYLDPHFVQESVAKSELKEKLGTYSCKELMLVNFADIDTSIGLVFLIRNDGKDFVEFITEFNKISKDPDSFLGLEINPINFDNLEIDDFESDKLSDM